MEESHSNNELEGNAFEAKEKLWGEACFRARSTGNVDFSWQKIGYISQHVCYFEKKYGLLLKQFRCDGNHLSNIDNMVEQCTNLVFLSLGSNDLTYLPEGICRFSKLRHLNLIRNRLTTLPFSVGDLVHLEKLEISNNNLNELPATISQLKQIKSLNLEVNLLTMLPESIIQMRLETLNCNFNRLRCLPNQIYMMTSLKSLYACCNEIEHLPERIGDSKSISRLHLSNNKISQLPWSLGKLSSLESLWLSFNKITALPFNFHALENLHDLQIEGNDNLALPSIEVVSKGINEVRRWCLRRYQLGIHRRKRNIVEAVQDVLQQVGENRICGCNNEPHSSIFSSNVSFSGYLWYQFPLNYLFTSFLPQLREIWKIPPINQISVHLRSFDYEREEVEQTLSEYQDAAGDVLIFEERAPFAECSCALRNESGSDTCNFMWGFRCRRPAVLVKMTLQTEHQVTQKEIQKRQQEHINYGVENAERAALQFLSSERGMNFVHEAAEVLQEVLDDKSPCNNAQTSPKILPSYKHWIQAISTAIQPPCESTQCMTMTADSKEFCQILNEVTKFYRLRPDLLKEEMKKAFQSITGLSYNDKIPRKEIMRCTIKVLRDHFVMTTKENKKKHMLETEKDIRKVLRRWIGLSLKETFAAWVKASRQRRIYKDQEDCKQKCESRFAYESQMVVEQYAHEKKNAWIEHWDEHEGCACWVHKITKEVTYHEPTRNDFLPLNWVAPDPPRWMVDEANKLVPPSVILKEASIIVYPDRDDAIISEKMNYAKGQTFFGLFDEAEAARARILEKHYQDSTKDDLGGIILFDENHIT